MNTYLEPQPVHTSPKSPHHPMIFPCFMLKFQKSHQKSSFFIDESHPNPMKTIIFSLWKKAKSAQGQGRQGFPTYRSRASPATRGAVPRWRPKAQAHGDPPRARACTTGGLGRGSLVVVEIWRDFLGWNLKPGFLRLDFQWCSVWFIGLIRTSDFGVDLCWFKGLPGWLQGTSTGKSMAWSPSILNPSSYPPVFSHSYWNGPLMDDLAI